jgi:putative acetyltransferase
VDAERPALRIETDDLSSSAVANFLGDHLTEMRSTSPPESTHALDIEALRQPNVTVWTVWSDLTLVGCGALKKIDDEHCELKSMRTSPRHKRIGVASLLLTHIVTEATARGFRRMSLETGSMNFYDPARKLYLKYGFEFCGPFGEYGADPNSVFMTKVLRASPPR